ncbi:MAG: glycosyltransferase family 39 protein [Verrucomicrobia bacterium]|nr:glycosyltransferase family 39 protein [Verrucomicrobiota bacterium]
MSPEAPTNRPPSSADGPTTRQFALFLLGLAVLFIAFAGSRGLNEPDEGRYANIPAAMLEPGADWLEPRLSGFAHYDKPPLIYWVTAISFRAFGVNEWAARAPSMLGALLAIAGVGWVARRIYGREVAFWALLVCGTLGQFWFLARFLSPDMLLTGFCSLGVAAWAESRHRGGDWKFWFLSLICWTLAWWTKATAALVPLLGLFIGVLATRDRAGLRALRPWFLLPGILALGSPWYLEMLHRHAELKDFFFGRELAGRVTGHADGRRGKIYYHFALSFALWAPWLPALLGAWLVKRRQLPLGGWRALPSRLGVEGFIVLTGLIVLSLISSKLPSYTLPLAPWAALVLARGLLRLRAVVSPAAFRGFTGATVGILIALAVAVMIVMPRREASLGLSSPMRPIAAKLRELGATSVYVDRHFSGLEIYFGPRVRYVVPRAPQQRSDDAGICAATGDTHFATFEEFPAKLAGETGTGVWLVHYDNGKPNNPSPFLPYLKAHPPLAHERLGDFDFWRVR